MSQELTNYNDPLAQIGQMANAYASQNVFEDYQERRAVNTLRRQKTDLSIFSKFLAEAGVTISGVDLYSDPEAWRYITYGLLEGFKRWMLTKGYAVGTVNMRLSTVKCYAELATLAQVLSTDAHARIKMVHGYSYKEVTNVDKKRKVTRVGSKKIDPMLISKEQVAMLKSQPNTPQGKRDTLLICLLLDHGLRCGEIAGLTVKSLNLAEGTLTFYREKVQITQIHNLTKDTLRAASRYIEACKPTDKLIMGSYKGGAMHGAMTVRAITYRASVLGKRIGLVGLSAHDGRHYWATSAVKGGTDIKSLQDAGGWSSPVMPLRYVASSSVANKGVTLG